MNFPNPYAPPNTETLVDTTPTTNQLLTIWIWLPIAGFGAMVATPAEIFLILFAMVFALLCFLTGVFWASNLDATRRWLFTIVCAILAGTIGYRTWHPAPPSLAAIGFAFACVNLFLGVRSCLSICHNRLRIFGTLSIAYLFGLLFGPIGIVLICVPSVFLANRSAALVNGTLSER